MGKIEKMKKCVGLSLILGLTMGVGCAKPQTLQLSPRATITVKQEEAESTQEITTKDFEVFFKKYFSLTEEDLLLLNQNPSQVNGQYWVNHKAYQKKVQSVFEGYLAKSLTDKLKEDYLFADFHFPRKLEINTYLTINPSIVERVHINTTQLFGENIIYEVSITTQSKVQPASEAYKQYRWNEQKNYYVKVIAGQISHVETSLENTLSEAHTHNAYLYSQAEERSQAEEISQADEIKLVHHYWVEAKREKTLQIVSIKEASPLQREGEARQKAINTSHIDRIAYYNEVSEKQQEVIKKVFNELMKQPRSFYYYYEKAIKSNFGVFEAIWNTTLKLKEEVTLSPDSYETTFASLISPYKDNIREIEADIEKITITPSIYATRVQPRFIVTLPVKVLLRNNQIAYYNYKYYVGTEANKIEFIQLMNMESINETTYIQKGV